MEPTPCLPFVVTLDDSDDPADVIDALALGRFVAAIEPAARSVRLNRVRQDAPLMPAGVRPGWTATDGGRSAALARGEGWSLRVVRWSDRSAQVTVTAETDELAGRILEAATLDAVEPSGADDEVVTVGFWHQHQRGTPRRLEREIAIEPWPTIRRNYSARAVGALEALMAIEEGELAGRLVLLHGPPGTGKTTALRSLAHAWRSWCRLEVVVDPERLLGDSGYLMSFVVGEDDDEARKWRLVVLEDCDELIRADAKRDTGQSLARLLNMTDGIIGQGLEVLIALTTNEPIHQLHPAIVRPGRCLAEIQIGPLSRLEALDWLGQSDGIGSDGATLAELFARRGTHPKLESRTVALAAGQYL
jgi:hypothetical protein